jgi:beta-glucosidase
VYVAGSNADDEGNQSGGWTLTWQGQSGDVPGATSILQGMRKVAPAASITYSKDASASMAGYHLGVVVVGETPYAEGMGDVGNNGHTLQLSVADRDAVDKVCAAMRCVVLDVSGRPQDITGIVPAAAGVVASWLPGSEGEGVADVLFGNRPFTGRLPETWAKASSQIPINVGDARYDPLYPYGWGLRTDGERGRLTTLRTQLRSQSGNGAVLTALDRALTPAYWNSKGIVTLAGQNAVLRALTEAAYLLTSARYTYAQQNAVVSVARDMVQSAVSYRGAGAMSATAAMTANAEHALSNGHPGYAVKLLTRARDKARTFGPASAARVVASGRVR